MNYCEVLEYYNRCRNYSLIYKNSNHEKCAYEIPVNTEMGYIEIYITKNLGQDIATDAVLTIYVNKDGNPIPVISLSPTQNPTIIELPIAHPQGTLVEGPEYFFTPYSLTIENEGYYNISAASKRWDIALCIEIYEKSVYVLKCLEFLRLFFIFFLIIQIIINRKK